MHKHDLVRQSLIHAARRIFVRFGFEKTTMNEIAMEARKGKSSLYYYFASKEEVFQAVVEHEAEILKEKIYNELNSPGDVLERLRKYFVVRFSGIKELGNLYNALRNDLLTHLEFIQKARHKYDELELSFIINLLQEGNDNDVFQVSDIPNTARTLHMTIKSVELPLLLSYETEIFEERLNSLIDIFFYGVVKR